MKIKICPFMKCDCLKEKCELWLDSVMSTEHIEQEGRCSIKFIAQKNEEGELPV